MRTYQHLLVERRGQDRFLLLHGVDIKSAVCVTFYLLKITGHIVTLYDTLLSAILDFGTRGTSSRASNKALQLEYHLEEHLELQARGLSTRYYNQ